VSSEFKVKTRFEILSGLNPDDDYIPGAGLLTSRACPEQCRFCLDPALNRGRTRFHSPEYVRDVLGYCADSFPGANGFFFGDATFTMNKKRLYRILSLIGDLPYSFQIQTRADYLDERLIDRLAESRFTAVAIGAESFNREILNEVAGKRMEVGTILDSALTVKRSGMRPVLTFIAGLPGETRSSIERTVTTLMDNGLHTATFFPLVVFKGTALYDQFRQSATPDDMERARLNPYSEEYIYTSDEFPTPEDLKSFTERINKSIVESRPPGW
jgi:radical SAM superfamily enzyme YgiQ (UPF0313 family)